MPSASPLSAAHRMAYRVINLSSAPFWLAMIIAPQSRVTARIVGLTSSLFLALGATYDVLLAAGMTRAGRPIDFSDPEAVRAALGQPETFLAAWGHFIAFDLFVGRWIWSDANARGTRARLSLLLTWLAGPAGLSLYLTRRGR